MKTQLQELFEYESDLTNMFDSDVRVAGAILEYIRTNKKDMLEKEKEMMCDFATAYMEQDYDISSQEYYNENVNAEE